MQHLKKRYSFLFISLLSLILMCILLIVHNRSTGSITELQKGNELAGQTFQINNALEEIINEINIVETDFQKKLRTETDSLPFDTKTANKKMAGYSLVISELAKNFNNQEVINNFAGLVNKKIAFFNLLANPENNKSITKNLIFSDENRILNDSIYVSALSIQIEAEAELQQKINRNFAVSKQALFISKGLTMLAIGAIMFLATIIILHLVRNNRLIKTIELSKNQANDAAKIKEQFLANMSHEIRTPVNSIIGFTNLLQKTSLQKDQTNFVTYIKSSGENLLHIVNDILDISKIEAGMLHIQKEPFSVSELCYYLEMMFFDESRKKQINFTHHISESVPEFIVGDETRLKQILSNLIGNAFKFTQHGRITLNIQTKSEKPGFYNLIFTVEDTGIGIPKDKIETIFDRFEQADSKTSKIYGGTGLGLSIVKQLVNMQGGDIQVKSEEGKGSVFTFAIPVQIPDELDISELKMESGLKISDKPEEIFPDNYKVLAAEDNKMNQFLLQYIFDQWHINYTIVNNGQEVIDLLSKELFDIVLMDIQMPVVDGYQAVKWIREEFKSKIPIVAMTAFVLQGEKDKCFSYGMNDYLPKPIDEIILKQMLIKYLPQTLINHAYRYINLTYLKNVFNSDKQFIINVLELFKTQYPKDLLLLKQAIENKDVVKIKASAHHLKSTFTSVNAAFPFLSILEWLEELNTGITDWESIAGKALPLFEAEKTALLEINEVLMQL